MDKPLVSITLETYNQERYVRDSVRGVLAQTYEPLQIIISDDCSKDSTWAIISEEVDQYKQSCGVHKNIILNRNEQNLGVARHVQKVFSMSLGALIVDTAGDDISMPNRVERIVEAWQNDGCRATTIHHSGWAIDIDGKILGVMRESNNRQPLGAAMAYDARVSTEFGSITHPGCSEDVIFTARAMMLGTELVIADKLLKYRVGSGVSSVLTKQRPPSLRGYVGWANAYKQVFDDLEYYRPKLSDAHYQELKQLFEKDCAYAQGYVRLVGGKTFKERLSGYRVVKAKIGSKRWILQMLYLLPERLGDFFLDSGTRVKIFITRMQSGRK